jgi:hypothetical protein
MPETIFSTLRKKFEEDYVAIEDALAKAYQDYQRYDYHRYSFRSYYDEFANEERMIEPEAFGFFVKHAIKHPEISEEAKEFICKYHINRPNELSGASNLLSAVNFLISRDQFNFSDEKLIKGILASFDRGHQPKDVESKVQFIDNLMKSEKLTKQFKLQLPNFIFTRSFCEGCPGEIFNAFMSSAALSDEEKLNLCQSFIGKRRVKNEIPLPPLEELLQDGMEIDLDPEDLENMSKEEVWEVIITQAIQKYLADNPWLSMTHSWVSESINRYAVLWYGKLCSEPKAFIANLKKKKFDKWEQEYVALGILDLINEIHHKLDQEYVQKVVKGYSEHPIGKVRQQAYIYGYHIISEDFTRQGLHDQNKQVADFIKRFLERGGKPSKGGRPKRKK